MKCRCPKTGPHLRKDDEHLEHDGDRQLRRLPLQAVQEPLHGTPCPPLGAGHVGHQGRKGEAQLHPHHRPLPAVVQQQVHDRVPEAANRARRQLLKVPLDLLQRLAGCRANLLMVGGKHGKQSRVDNKDLSLDAPEVLWNVFHCFKSLPYRATDNRQ